MRRCAAIAAAFIALPATATAATGPSLSVDAGADRHAISPYVYGMNFADQSLADEIDLPVDRQGGNKADTLNWKNGVSSTSNDYFFENLPWCWPGCPDPFDPERAYTNQIEANRTIGAKSLIDVPMMGYVADEFTDAHPVPCSFTKTAFPVQEEFDPFDAECGNGKMLDGVTWVTNAPQRDTALAVGPAYMGDWVDDLVGRYDTAANGGVAFYELGNEPALWSDTHHDWHPDAVTFDELFGKSRDLALEIKAGDPSAATLGPAEWGWPHYFCSAADNIQDGCSPADTDRAAHGGKEISAWFLEQFKAYADANGGTRLLDYFDLHYYRQGGAALDVTRSLWDPTYTDPSWINDQIELIPRMRAWVADNYPGTKISLSEYDLSTGNAAIDPLIQAEVLGIFGREQLDLATRWDAPAAGDGQANAWRLFRNYDGAGSKYGETWIRSQSGDQGLLAVYGSQRSADGALTLVVINKTLSSLDSSISLAGFTPGPVAKVYSWAGGSLARGADIPVGATGLSATFAPRSMSLIEVPAPGAPAGGGTGGTGETPPPPADGTAPPPPAAVTPRAKRCVVPKLKGLKLPAAKRKLAKAGCRLGRVRKAKSRKRKGVVIAQKPKARSIRAPRTRVALVLSRGRR